MWLIQPIACAVCWWLFDKQFAQVYILKTLLLLSHTDTAISTQTMHVVKLATRAQKLLLQLGLVNSGGLQSQSGDKPTRAPKPTINSAIFAETKNLSGTRHAIKTRPKLNKPMRWLIMIKCAPAKIGLTRTRPSWFICLAGMESSV